MIDTYTLFAVACAFLCFACFAAYNGLRACTSTHRRRLRDEYEPEIRHYGLPESMALLGRC
jgi:hypothetical protein